MIFLIAMQKLVGYKLFGENTDTTEDGVTVKAMLIQVGENKSEI